MDKQSLKYFAEKLLNYEKELKSMQNDEKKSDSIQEMTGELNKYDNHPADHGSETYEKIKDGILDNNVDQILNSIENALKRIERGNYGYCENCNKKISIDRLQAVPYTAYCINCMKTVK